MTDFILDASVALAWCFEDESTPASYALLESLTAQKALVPPLWRWEIGNALLSAERRGRLDAGAADLFLRLLEQLPIQVDAQATHAACGGTRELAHAHGLSGYDAAYLELAQRSGLPLATRDEDLAAAARAAGLRLLPT